MISKFSLSLIVYFSSIGAFGQVVSSGFIKIEEINENYSVGFKAFDEEFEGYGDLWIISKSDTFPIVDIGANICNLWNASPNGRYAFFETLSMDWLEVGDSTFLHDRWSGALVELETARVVKHCRFDCGDEWNELNFWMQNGQIIFNGNDTITRSNETVYTEDESSDIAWISYHETDK